jgi:hypothetical protein
MSVRQAITLPLTPGQIVARLAGTNLAVATLVIGTDPGGSELLRVGGSAKISGGFSFSGTGTPIGSGVTIVDRTDTTNTRLIFCGPDNTNAGAMSFVCSSANAGVFVTALSLSRTTVTVGSGVNLVIGTDPGGSELLRVGGGFRFTADSILTSTTDAASTTAAALVVTGGIAWGPAKSAYGGGLLLVSPTIGLGYATGAGGTVTQATSRTTGVTLNKVCGEITLFTAAGSATAASFTVTNSAMAAATDQPHVTVKSGTNKYLAFVTAKAAGSFEITFYTTGGTASDAPVFSFDIIKAVAA